MNKLDLLLRKLRLKSIKFDELSIALDQLRDKDRPPLDRKKIDLEELNEKQKFWRENGYLILENFIPEELLVAFEEVRKTAPIDSGWGPVPFIYLSEIRDICLYKPLLDILENLLREEVILHLNLTGWKSSTRNWHQDDYLNPSFVKGHYLALWLAIDDIHPDSGPFEFIPGSHRHRVLDQSKVRSFLPEKKANESGQPGEKGHWASYSEGFVSKACEKYIKDRKLEVKSFLGKRGDALIWHGNLLHRGSKPKNPKLLRKTLIAHYSGAQHRPDMTELRTHNDRGLYFKADLPLIY